MDLFSTSSADEPSLPVQFNLTRDLVFFDIESTGLNVMQDRIIQIALIKYHADGRPFVEKEYLVDPKIPISKEAMAVHGITPDMLKGKPAFAEYAQEIFDFVKDADLAGYNSDRFDLPMLTEELFRCGLELDMEGRRTVDVQKIFYKMEPRTLKAALRVFCDKELEGAHDALADVRATVEVLGGQIAKYDGVDYTDGDGFVTKAPIKNDIQAIHDFISDSSVVDFTRRLKRNHRGEILFNFGKYTNQKVEDVFRKDKNYYHWIMQKDFSSQVKKIVTKIMEGLQGDTNR